MSDKLERYYKLIPKLFKPRTNPNINALLQAWAGTDQELVTQIANAKSQIFIRTAEGQYLDRAASNVGVARIAELGLLDEEFQELIPNLSLKAKQIRSIFYDTMDVFWGQDYSRINIDSSFSPFGVSDGDTLSIKIDGGRTQLITVRAGEITTPGAATAEEMQVVLNRIDGCTISLLEDRITSDKYLNVRTNTPGAKGSIEIVDGIIATNMNFTVKKHRITDLAQRTVIYELNHKEVIVELPAIVPALRRTLKGSHHFHADSTIEGAVAPANKVWEGSFLFDPNGVSYTVTGTSAVIQEEIVEGQVYTKLTVDDASEFPNEPGTLIFNWGRDGEEQPVKYLSRPNNSTILLDPAYTFTQTHAIGTRINIINDELKPLTPEVNGEDLAIYLTSPSGARTLVQEILETLTAAGVIVNFVVLLPAFKYLVSNPYSDD